MTGGAGLTGVDSAGWIRMFSAFKTASQNLCSALSRAAYLICTEELQPGHLDGFLAGRLIALDKRPGIRPIAVGEVYRRIVCRAIAGVIEYDVMKAVAPVQLCVGIPSACEIATHAVRQMFNGEEAVEGVLLIDASNAFNSVNRIAALHNIPRVCPAAGQVFRNCYSSPIALFVDGGERVLSREGTCQGDPLAMSYALATQPLVQELAVACPTTSQIWFADDDAALGKLLALRSYWDKVDAAGPGYGYFPNSRKSVLLVKPEMECKAREIFSGTGVAISVDGTRYLGSAVGNPDFVKTYINKQVESWSSQVKSCATMAESQPHAAYHVMVNSIQRRWSYALRSTDISPENFAPLDAALDSGFLPSLTGRPIDSDGALRGLLSLPARNGGLNIPVPSAQAAAEYAASKHITEPYVKLLSTMADDAPPPSSSPVIASSVRIPSAVPVDSPDVAPGVLSCSESCSPVQPVEHDVPVGSGEKLVAVRRECQSRSRQHRIARRDAASASVQLLRPQLSQVQNRLVESALEPGVSSWLTACPRSDLQMVLSKRDFRDALCIRYGFPVDGLSETCVCGQDMTVDHAFVCPSGGYPSARHNELRDLLASVIREVQPDVEVEPRLLPLSGESLPHRTCNRDQEARVDIRARGFWTRQQEAFFDVRVTHPKASLLSRSEIKSHLLASEREKKRQYASRIVQVDHGVFTPLVFSTYGQCAPECRLFLKRLIGEIVNKDKELHYSMVMQHLRCRISFCLLRWAITCLRGSRSSYTTRQSSHFSSQCRQLGLTV